ncbi:MAG: hypothetical protein ABJM58_14635 [Alteripontixanthobacter sp.]
MPGLTSRSARLAVLLVPMAGLSACAAAPDRYPSLAIRDVERVEGRFTPAPAAEPPAPASPQQVQTLAQLREQARTAHGRFLAAAPGAQRLITAARGSSDTSNIFIEAQVALSALESLRSETAIALGEADSLYIVAATEGRVNEPLEQTRAIIVDLVADEDTALAALRGQMGR